MKKARKRSGAPKLVLENRLSGSFWIVGYHHASRAERLNPLIKAISSSPRIEDYHLLAVRGYKAHASRVDIAEFANLGIDEAAATAVNAGGFFAKHPPSHVEVMNHHVAEKTARLG
jgi:hypothetical protein